MYKVKVKSMEKGKAKGISVKWENGQFCLVITDRGLLGCGIFNKKVIDEFKMIAALAKGTPKHPLVEPEDLLNAKVSIVSSLARKMGIKKGMKGKEVLNIFLSKPGLKPISPSNN